MATKIHVKNQTSCVNKSAAPNKRSAKKKGTKLIHAKSIVSQTNEYRFYTIAGGSIAGGAFLGASVGAAPGAVVGGLVGLGVAAFATARKKQR